MGSRSGERGLGVDVEVEDESQNVMGSTKEHLGFADGCN